MPSIDDITLAKRLLAERSFRIFTTARKHTRTTDSFCAVHPLHRHLCVISMAQSGHLVFRYHVALHYYKPTLEFLRQRLKGKLLIGRRLPANALTAPEDYIATNEREEFELFASEHYRTRA